MRAIHSRRLHPLVWPALSVLLLTSACQKRDGHDGKSAQPISARLDAIRAAGHPVTLAELNAWYAAPPAAEDAAPLYANAFAALASTNTASPTFLKQNQKALQLLHQAAGRKLCRYPIDLTRGVAVLLPHLSNIKKCSLLLSQEADSQAAKSRMDLAAQSLLDSLRLARSLENEPLLISYLVELASEIIFENALESAVNRGAFSEEQLARLQAACQEAESGMSLTRPLIGERCTAIGILEMPAPDLAAVLAQSGKKDVDTEAYRKSPAYEADFNFFLDRMEEGVAASTLPFPQCLEKMRQWATQLGDAQTKGHVISGMLLPALVNLPQRAAEGVGRLRAAQAAMAVERYRLAHANSLPGSPSQLAPQYLAVIPVDPFDGQPVRYKKLSPRGYVVYCLGRDGQDNDGTPRPANAKADGPYDLTFLVKR